MAKPPRDRVVLQSRTYFVTTRTFEGRALFQSESLAMLFLETLFHYRVCRKYELHAFVLMPNHTHVIVSPAEDVTLERAMQLIKGGFSHRAGREYGRLEIWQRGYVDHRIRDGVDYEHHKNYVEQNPVRARLVERPSEFRFSSAYPGYELDPVPQGLKPA